MTPKYADSETIPENLRPFCPVQKTISIIQAKWSLFILNNLIGGKKRFGQLRRSLTGVSPKTLSSRLKELEETGIVKRTIFAEVPPRVEYELTTKGASLGKVIDVMSKWGEKWMTADDDNRVVLITNASRNRNPAPPVVAMPLNGGRRTRKQAEA